MKDILSIQEMISYTSEHKHIVHNNYKESEDFLLLNNYQNVISAHKKLFHCGKDIGGKHIYPEKISFNLYMDAFLNERVNYSHLREKSSMFEFYFKNLVHHYFFQEYKNFCRGQDIICDENGIILFLKNREELFNIEVIKENCTKTIAKLIKNYEISVEKNISPFVFFTKLHLSEIRFVYLLLLKKNQSKIVKHLIEHNILNIDGKNSDRRLKNFTKVLDKLIGIRNVVIHNNSMEIYRQVDSNGLSNEELDRRIKNKNALINKALKMYA